MCWEEARTPAEKEAAGRAWRGSRPSYWTICGAECAKLEAAVPVIAEQVCSGSARVWDFGALPWAYECAVAAVNVTGHFPDVGPGWVDVERRVLAVMNALRALDPAAS